MNLTNLPKVRDRSEKFKMRQKGKRKEKNFKLLFLTSGPCSISQCFSLVWIYKHTFPKGKQMY